jgi:hypothetical protein
MPFIGLISEGRRRRRRRGKCWPLQLIPPQLVVFLIPGMPDEGEGKEDECAKKPHTNGRATMTTGGVWRNCGTINSPIMEHPRVSAWTFFRMDFVWPKCIWGHELTKLNMNTFGKWIVPSAG